MVDKILFNGKVTTMDSDQPDATAIAITGDQITAVGGDKDMLALAETGTETIDLRGQRVIPGLIDSHTHIIRQGNNFAMELRWDHVPSLADGLRLLKAQAQRTPAGQWIRVVGGWSVDQFAEKRLPTIDDINAVAPDVPVYVLHLYDRAWLNRAALRALGIDQNIMSPSCRAGWSVTMPAIQRVWLWPGPTRNRFTRCWTWRPSWTLNNRLPRPSIIFARSTGWG